VIAFTNMKAVPTPLMFATGAGGGFVPNPGILDEAAVPLVDEAGQAIQPD
jgi:hypothetical protein